MVLKYQLLALRKELQVYLKDKVLNENPEWREKSGKNTQITKDSIQDSFLFFMYTASSSGI